MSMSLPQNIAHSISTGLEVTFPDPVVSFVEVLLRVDEDICDFHFPVECGDLKTDRFASQSAAVAVRREEPSIHISVVMRIRGTWMDPIDNAANLLIRQLAVAL